MRKLILILVTIFCIQSVNAQDSGEINIGVGFIPTVLSGVSTSIPPISISYDHPFKDQITIGGYIGYFGSKLKDFGGFGISEDASYHYKVIIVGGRGTYHFDIDNDKLDPYVGLMLGYNVVSAKIKNCESIYCDDFAAATSGFGYAGLVGAKYQISDSFKAFGEIGYGISIITIGAVFSL